MDRRNPPRRYKKRDLNYESINGKTATILNNSNTELRHEVDCVRRSKKWACQACTLLNSSRRRKCEVCQTNRPILDTSNNAATTIPSVEISASNSVKGIKRASHDCPEMSNLGKKQKKAKKSSTIIACVQVRLNEEIRIERTCAVFDRHLSCATNDEMFKISIESKYNEKTESIRTATVKVGEHIKENSTIPDTIIQNLTSEEAKTSYEFKSSQTTEQKSTINTKPTRTMGSPKDFRASSTMKKKVAKNTKNEISATSNSKKRQNLPQHLVYRSETSAGTQAGGLDADFSSARRTGIEVSEEAVSKVDGFFRSETNRSVSASTSGKVDGLDTGFNSGSGTRIEVSDEAMSKADGLFRSEENANMSASTSARFDVLDRGFSSARGTPIEVSEEAMSKANGLFRSETSASTSEKRIMRSAVLDAGFSSASGTRIDVSEEAMSKADGLFRSETSASTRVGGFNGGFSSARGTRMDVSEEAITKANGLFRVEKSASDQTGVLDGGFKSARGAPIEVSEEAMSKADGLFRLEKSASDQVGGPGAGLSSVRGTPIEARKEAMSKSDGILWSQLSARNLLDSSSIPADPNVSDFSHSFPSGGRRLFESSSLKVNRATYCRPLNMTSGQSSSSRDAITSSFLVDPLCGEVKSTRPDTDSSNAELCNTSHQNLLKTTHSHLPTDNEIESEDCDELLRERIRSTNRMDTTPALRCRDHHKLSLSRFALKFGPMENDYVSSLNSGVKKIVMEINSENSSRLRFDNNGLPDSLLGKGGSDIDAANKKGSVLDFRVELIKLGCLDSLLEDKWICNHFRWIVWKLAAMERRFAKSLSNKYLSFTNVCNQLKSRFCKEIQDAKRPVLRKVLNRDIASSTLMILCISRIIIKGDEIKLCLTDGWYEIPALIDGHLQQFVLDGKLSIGTKLLICNALLEGADDGLDPLDNRYQQAVNTFSIRLKLFANSTRRCKWFSKLGLLKPHLEIKSLGGVFMTKFIKDVIPGGGPVPVIDLIICKKYPIMYVIERSDSSGSSEITKSVITEAQHAHNENVINETRSRLVENIAEATRQECAKGRSLISQNFITKF